MGASTPNCGVLLSSGMLYSTAAPVIMPTLYPLQTTITAMGSNTAHPSPSMEKGARVHQLSTLRSKYVAGSIQGLGTWQAKGVPRQTGGVMSRAQHLEVFQVHRAQRLWEEFKHFFHSPATSAVHFAYRLWVRNERQAFAANSKRVTRDVLRQIG